MKEWVDFMSIASRARKAVSFALLFKSAVGFSVATLALFGVAVPHLGLETNIAAQGAAAGVGAIAGALLALRG